MGRIVVTEFVSLDGVIEAPGGGEGYRHAGWTFEVDRGAEGDRYKLEEAMESEALLLGRITYDGFAAAWPRMQGEFADKFNGIQVRRLVDARDARVEQLDRAQG
jgi:dihydrofolate reductase